jgi:hypothetical protein
VTLDWLVSRQRVVGKPSSAYGALAAALRVWPNQEVIEKVYPRAMMLIITIAIVTIITNRVKPLSGRQKGEATRR